ncbi:DUF1127 domain-containing protein [Bradyrhizobium sp. SRS-191]|uniref:DUF1127 domain-containing protein n=1 Tax=Bradyrhizobium sp. SRS-191 TaxID=2962606 RepID=UPI00211EFA65|nr:DUF1127 domain-containing protein [Bradyrhizobium sp. SRS-191]
MPSTTNDPSVSTIGAGGLRHVLPPSALSGQRHPSSPGHSISSGANVYYLAAPSPAQDRTDSEPVSLLRLWWTRWHERRRFARELPWMADEVLADYGVTRAQARQMCRRPFWRA